MKLTLILDENNVFLGLITDGIDEKLIGVDETDKIIPIELEDL